MIAAGATTTGSIMAAKKIRSRIAHKPTTTTQPKPSPVMLNTRGVANWKEAAEWLRARGIEDIECITPDLAGVPRGKMMQSSKFTSNT